MSSITLSDKAAICWQRLMYSYELPEPQLSAVQPALAVLNAALAWRETQDAFGAPIAAYFEVAEDPAERALRKELTALLPTVWMQEAA